MNAIGNGIRDRVIELRRVRAGDLVPNPLNWREHPKAQRQAVQAVLEEIGYAGALLAIIIDDGRLKLIDGHLRAELDENQIVPVLVTDLSEAEADKLLTLYDPLSAMATADKENLDSLLKQIEFESPVLQAMAARLAAENAIVPAPKIEAVDMPPASITIVKPGDVWICGAHRVMAGDCRRADDMQTLMQGATAQMLFTDPPYMVDYQGGHFHSEKPNVNHKREKLKNDDGGTIYADFLPAVLPYVDGPLYVWFGVLKSLPVFDALQKNKCEVSAVIIWNKTNATYASMGSQYKQRYEPCIYAKKRGSTLRWIGPADENTVWDIARDAKNEYHPTQKPVALAARALANHNAQAVLDVFAGSFSTMLAAEQMGRRCYSMEINPAYVQVGMQRWAALTGQEPILEATGETLESLIEQGQGQNDGQGQQEHSESSDAGIAVP